MNTINRSHLHKGLFKECRTGQCPGKPYANGFCKECYMAAYHANPWHDGTVAKKWLTRLEQYHNFNSTEKAYCTYCKNVLTEYNTAIHKMKIILSSKKRSLPCRECDNKLNKIRREANKEREVNKHLRKCYGVDLEWYNTQFEKQNGVCAICKEKPKPNKHGKINRLNVDHNHQTGQVRALLCPRCNHRVVGVLEKSCKIPRIVLNNLYKYFQEHSMKGDNLLEE